MEFYFTLKTWFEYYIPLAFLGLIVLIVIIVILRTAWKSFKGCRNAKYLEKCGYERNLIYTPDHWGYKKYDCKTIMEDELLRTSKRNLKKRVERGR